jgi:hypothetical protein
MKAQGWRPGPPPGSIRHCAGPPPTKISRPFLSCARKIELVFRGPGSIPVHKPCAAGFGLFGGRRPAGKKHLLKRTPHHTDRRAFLIELTPEGEACFKEHHEFHLKMTRKIVSGLTASEQKTFADVIEKILKKSDLNSV